MVSSHRQQDALVARTVDALTQGKLTGWYQDRFEWGPRTLGNRSILAHSELDLLVMGDYLIGKQGGES